MKAIFTLIVNVIFITQISAQINSFPTDNIPIQNVENAGFFHPDSFYSVKDDVLNLDSIIYYQFSSPVDSSPYEKEVYTYTTEQQIEKIILSKWKQEDNGWENEKQTEYEYDSEGRIISETTTVFTVSSWFLGHKIITYYTSWGAISRSQFFNWSMEENDWELSREMESIFDEYQRRAESFHYMWDHNSGTMLNHQKYEYIYEDSDNPDYLICYYRTDNNDNWEFAWKYALTYDSAGNNLSFTTFEWNQSFQDWVEYNKFESTYGESNELLSQTRSEWDTINNQWFYTSNHQYEYDDIINLIRNIEQIFDTINDIWVNVWKEEVAYNPDWDINYSNYFSWDSIPEMWKIDGRQYYYYSVLAVQEIFLDNTLVYPNPAGNQVNISNESADEIFYELYSMEGKKTISSNSNDKTILISTNTLKPGTYILRMSYKNLVTSRKIIIH